MSVLWLMVSTAQADGVLGGLPSVVGIGEEQPLLHAQPAGDLDGDGLGDLVFGAPYDDTAVGHESGQVWILSGADLGDVSRWTPVQDVAVGLAGEATQDHAGYDVAAVGDVNGDGLADITVGAPDASVGQPTAGKVYMVYGRDGFASGSLGTEEQFYGTSPLTHLGARVYPAGDLDGDGMNDVLLGAPWPTPNGTPGPGFMVLFYGRAEGWPKPQPVTMSYSPSSAVTSADAVFLVFAAETYAGRSAAVVADPLGDGRDGLLLGVPGYTDPFSGHTANMTGAPPPHGGLGADEPGSGHAHTLAHGAAYLMTAPGPKEGRFVVRDEAHGIVFGEAAGDMLPWAIAGLADGRAVLTSPDANETAGGAWLLSNLTEHQSATDADVIWSGRDAGDLLGWSVAAVDGIDAESVALLGSPGWEGGLGRVSFVGDEGGIINDVATVHLRGCLEDGLAGWSVRSHPGPDPDGVMQPWVGITAPSASVYADGDGAAYVLTAGALDQLDGDCNLPDAPRIDADGDGYDSDEDCDDSTAWIYPGAVEVCGNGVDEDCDGDIDEDCGTVPTRGCATVPGTGSLWLLLLPLLWTRRRGAAAAAVLLLPAVSQADEPIVLIWGSAAEEYLQGPLATGDFNADGQIDLAVANHRGFAVQYATGEVFLIDGTELSGEVDLAGWSDVLYGETEHDYLGRDLVVLPDADGDGLLIGQTFAGLTSADQGELVRFDGPLLDGIPRRVDAAPAAILGDAETDWLGEQVLMAGDLDGDGLDDIVASAPTRDGDDTETAGVVWVFHNDITALEGRTVAPQVASARIEGDTGNQAGWRLLAPGDLNGDGRDDLIVGMVDGDTFGGRLAVFSGVARGASLRADEQPNAWVLPEPDTYPGFGLDAGDVDGDGVNEVVVGTHTAAQGAGQVWLLDGRPDGLRNITQDAVATFVGEPGEGIGYSLAVGPAVLVGAPTSGSLHVLDYNLLPIGHTTGAELGRWVGWLDDFDGDGIKDAGIVDSAASGDRPQQGAAWLVSGASLLAGDLSALRIDPDDPDADGDGAPASEDCDDGDPRRAPTLSEVCRDGLDNDCDGIQDETPCARACATVAGQGHGVGGWGLTALMLVGYLRRRATCSR